MINDLDTYFDRDNNTITVDNIRITEYNDALVLQYRYTENYYSQLAIGKEDFSFIFYNENGYYSFNTEKLLSSEWKAITDGVSGGTSVDISSYTDAKEFYVKCGTLTVLIPTAIYQTAFRTSYYASSTNFQYMNVNFLRGTSIVMNSFIINGSDETSNQKYNVYYR